VVLPYYLFHVEKHICLSRDMQVTGAAWWTAIMIETGVGDLVQMIENGQSQVGYSVAGRLRCHVILCMVYTVHKEIMNTDFLVQSQNQGRRFLPICPQNRWLRFVKTTGTSFLVYGSKLIAVVW
jgi:hypothetical protein